MLESRGRWCNEGWRGEVRYRSGLKLVTARLCKGFLLLYYYVEHTRARARYDVCKKWYYRIKKRDQ